MAKHNPKAPRVRLVVTKETIDQAVPRDSSHCMFADSLRVAFPTAQKIAIDLATMRFTDPKRRLRYTYLTPRIAQVALVNFDRGVKPEPFSLVLRGGHVTRAGSTKISRGGNDESKERRSAIARHAGRKLQSDLRGKKLVVRKLNHGTVPDVVGGRTPPMQKGSDGVPFTRRRAFGLRALEY